MTFSTTPSTCFANGSITISLSGSDVGSLSQIAYTAIHSSTQETYVSTNPVIENLPKGNYSVILDAYYQNTIPFQKTGSTTVPGTYVAPTAFKINDSGLIGTRKTLKCKNSGRVSLKINGGVFPYTVETYLNSTLLKSETFSTNQNSGTNENLPDYKDYYNIENLPAGYYTFKIKDGCNYVMPIVSEMITQVTEDFHCQLIAVKPSTNINHYNIVNIDFGDNIVSSDELYKYYYDQVHRNIPWWEYTYSYNGGTDKNWKNIPTTWETFDTVSSASKYCDMWGKNYKIKVRVKGCGANACVQDREIKFGGVLEIFSHNIFDQATGCVDEENIKVVVVFRSNELNAFYTAPIYYKITDILSGQVLVENSVNARSWAWEKIMNRNRIGDKLQVIVNDCFNCVLINGSYTIPPSPEVTWLKTNFNRVCSGASDFDFIRWSWNECLNSGNKPPNNTKIELIESPNSNYYHFVATFNHSQNKWTITQDNLSGFTVFAEESCNIKLQGKDLLSGIYKWRITDGCGRNETLQANYEFYSFEIEEPFSFNIQTFCDGKRYEPKVKLKAKRKGDNYQVNAPVSFEVTGVPGGFAPSSGVCNIDYVTLSLPGNYQISFNYLGTDLSCLIPPKSMFYNPSSLSLINVYGYACEDEIKKVVKVVINVDSTTGMAPFLFEIFKENGDYITSNHTGIFYDVGAPDEYLLVRITDQCGATINNQRVKITNLLSGAKIAFADNTHVCFGGDIRLHGISIVGAQMGYRWTGPDAFSSQSKDPVITNADYKHEGTYFLTVEGLECSVKDDIYITILMPDTGYIDDFVCRGERYIRHGFDIEPLDIPNKTYTFYLSDLKTTEYNCDSTSCLFLTVKDYAFLSTEPLGEICADEPYFILPWNFYDETKLFYNIVFNDIALQNGFQNVDSGAIVNPHYLEIAIPQGIDKQDYITPHHYSATLFVNNGSCNSRLQDLPIKISYPAWIIEQKWNDVIALLNDRYNGGYLFSKYEWYKNGRKLEGEGGSYIYILPSLEFGAEYRALITRASDGEAFFTCPLKPEYRSGIRLYPQLVSKNEPVFIETQQNCTALIWNILGQKIAQHSVYENQINKIYVNQTGFFLVEIITENEHRETFKIIVK